MTTLAGSKIRRFREERSLSRAAFGAWYRHARLDRSGLGGRRQARLCRRCVNQIAANGIAHHARTGTSPSAHREQRHRWTPDSWTSARGAPAAQLPRCRGARRRHRRTLANYPAAGLRRRGARADGRARRGRRGRGLPAPGRRLRRKLRRVPPQQHPRHLPRAAADGGGADLRQQAAGGEGRPHGRPVRQAALAPTPRRSTASTLPSYLGDNVNDIDFTPESAHARSAADDPAYSQSAATLNLLRAFASGGYANLHQVHQWTLDFMGRSPWADKFADVADRIGEALDFMEACGIDPETVPQLKGTNFYTSHEALLLPYEQALTRQDSPDRRLVRHQRAHAVDRRPHPLRGHRRMSSSCAASAIRSA